MKQTLKTILEKSFHMLISDEKQHIPAQFTSFPLTSPSPIPCFLHLLPSFSPWRNCVLTCAKHRGGRHCRMFVFTLQIYTIIFSTKFEPFELDREQKMVWIMFYWLQCFVSIKANTYHGHIPFTCSAGVYETRPMSYSSGSQLESIFTLVWHTVQTISSNKNISQESRMTLRWFCETLE